MNDGGFDKYEYLEYYDDKEFHNGKYCEDCASDVKTDRVPALVDCETTFLLKMEKETRKWVMSDISRDTLHDCIQELLAADQVCVAETKKIDNIAKDPYNWQTPEEAYKFFIKELLPEMEDDRCSKWLQPPLWTTSKGRIGKLERDIFYLEQEIHNQNEKLKRKKRKLEILMEGSNEVKTS